VFSLSRESSGYHRGGGIQCKPRASFLSCSFLFVSQFADRLIDGKKKFRRSSRCGSLLLYHSGSCSRQVKSTNSLFFSLCILI
jgi:hypothetical protein